MNIENIQPEIIILIVGILVASLIIIIVIQGNSKRRKKLREDLDTLESVKADGAGLEKLESLNIKKEIPFLVNAINVLQVLIGIGLLIGFSWWTYYLIQKGYAWWGIASGIFALIGLFIPLSVWSDNKRRQTNIKQLIQGIESYKNSLVSNSEPSVAEAGAKIEEAISKQAGSETVLKVKETDMQNNRWQNIDDMIQFCVSKDKSGRIPEDSALKRHFVTTLVTEIESGIGVRPADATLRRHFDANIDTGVENSLQAERPDKKAGAAIMQEPAVREKSAAEKLEIKAVPEDLAIKPDALANLRVKIEAGMPNRPTDSTLRRHFDAMVDALVDSMSNKHQA